MTPHVQRVQIMARMLALRVQHQEPLIPVAPVNVIQVPTIMEVIVLHVTLRVVIVQPPEQLIVQLVQVLLAEHS